jgi:ABC-2 type transport system permease protein
VFVAVFLILDRHCSRSRSAASLSIAPRGPAAVLRFHPWIFMVFLPAVAMRLWAEESRSGAIELLMTLPAPTWSLVLGKFLAAWSDRGHRAGADLPALDHGQRISAHPDNAAIFTAYLASFLMAGAYIAIGSVMSALTQAQIVAFVLAVLVSFPG